MGPFSNCVIIVPSSKKKEWLQYRDLHPEENFSLYSENEFISMFHYSHEEGALSYLLSKGYSLEMSEALLSSLSLIEKAGDVSEPYREDYLELIKNGHFYKSPYPEKLFEGKTIYYSSVSELSLKEAKRHLPNNDFVPLENEENGEAPFYRFKDVYEGIHYLLNDIAKEIDEGRDVSSIYVYGLSGVALSLAYMMAPRFGFSFPGIDVPLSSDPLFKAFMSKINEGVSDREVLFSLIDEKDSGSEKKIASLIKTFEEFPFAKRKALYEENSHSISVSGPKGDINVLNEPYAPKDSLVYVLNASLGSFPTSHSEDCLLPDEKKGALGLLTSSERNLISEAEAKSFLKSPNIKWVSYFLDSGGEKCEPTYLIDKKSILEAPLQDYEYSHDKGALLGAMLLDEKEDSGYADPRLSSISEETLSPYGTFPKKYEKFSVPRRKKAHSYSAISAYPACPYKYYCDTVLGLNAFEETFNTLLGTYCHAVLEYTSKGESLDEAKTKAMEEVESRGGDFSEKERILLKKFDDLIGEFVEQQKDLESHLGHIEIKEEVSVPGQLDEIPVYAKIDKLIDIHGHLLVYDYKTSKNQMFDYDLFSQFGLKLQLPFYAMTLKNSSEYRKDTISGLFIAPFAISRSDTGIKDKAEDVSVDKLRKSWRNDGLGNGIYLNAFFEEGDIEKYFTAKTVGDKVGKELVLSEGFISECVDRCEEWIKEFDGKISKGEFEIAPFRVNKPAFHSCDYCQNRDICYRKEEDVKYKVSDIAEGV